MQPRIFVTDMAGQFEHQSDGDTGGWIAKGAGAAHGNAARFGHLGIDRGIAHTGGDEEFQVGQGAEDRFRERGPFAHGDDDLKSLQRGDDFVGSAEMLLKYFDFDAVFDLAPIGDLERHVLVVIEDRAANCHVASPIRSN